MLYVLNKPRSILYTCPMQSKSSETAMDVRVNFDTFREKKCLRQLCLVDNCKKYQQRPVIQKQTNKTKQKQTNKEARLVRAAIKLYRFAF